MTVKATNYKRKTPCAETKRGFQNPAITTIWCRCCGEWERKASGRIVRYIERTW